MAMAPPQWVLLDRHLRFVPVPTGGARGKQAAAIDEIDDEAKAMETLLQAMEPDPSFSGAPELSRLTMMQPIRGGPPSGTISSTDKALVVLIAGHYRPFFSRIHSPSSGCYLVYDASSNSLTAVPQIPPSKNFRGLGRSSAIISRGTGTYVVAEICAMLSNCPAPNSSQGPTPNGALYQWQQQSTSRPRTRSQDQAPSPWVLKTVHLPSQVFDDYTYFIDMVFTYAGSSSSTCICWVDLLKGIMVCNPFREPDDEGELTFIPLPQGYVIDLGDRPRPRPEQFRTMGCVNGVIKFVALVGFYEKKLSHYEKNLGIDGLVLRSWTLSPDLKEWKECHPPLALQDLWASESFRKMNLPNIAPSFPIVSVDEDDVVYLSLREDERKDVYDIYGQYEGAEVVNKAHYVLRFDMIKNKVLHCRNANLILSSFFPALLASEFTAYLPTGWKDHEGVIEASKTGTDKKQVDH